MENSKEELDQPLSSGGVTPFNANQQPIGNNQTPIVTQQASQPLMESPTVNEPTDPTPPTTPLATPPQQPTAVMDPITNTDNTLSGTIISGNFVAEESAGQTFKSPANTGSATPIASADLGKHSKKKMFIILGASLTTLTVGGLVFYFGYWTNPSVIWSNALSTTAISYDKTVGYLNSTTTKSNFNGTKLASTLKISSGGQDYSGSLDVQSDKLNSQASLKINLGNSGLGLGNVDIEEESIIAPNQKSPDIYLKLGGLSDLINGFTGLTVDSTVFNNNWVKISHIELDGILANVLPITASNSNATSLTQSDIYGAAKDFGTINSKYVFTTNPNYSVTKIEKKIGFETIDGHKTYHYVVGFNSQNVQNYITAIRDSLDKDTLGTYIKSNSSGQTINDFIGYDNLIASAKNITDSDNVDIWVDTGTRTIYKIRKYDPSNPTMNYIEAGLNFKNFDSFPFFINSQNVNDSVTDKIGAQITIMTKQNTLNFNIADTSTDSKDSTNNSSATLNGSLQFTSSPLAINAPTNTISLKQALVDLGLGDSYDSLVTPSSTNQSSVLSFVPGANSQLIHLLANAKLRKH